MVGSTARDDGFSMIEVLFAAFIAFFVLTALFGVMVTSAQQGSIAAADTVANNLVQLVVEQARALPYDDVGLVNPPAGQPLGVLPSEETTTFQGLEFQIRREVTWHDDPTNNSGGLASTKDYKDLTVLVSWTGGHTTPLFTSIRDHSNESPPLPSVRWIAQPDRPSAQTWQYPVLFSNPSAPTQTFVWDGLTTNGHLSNLASIQASASINATGAVIARVEFWCGQYMLATPWTQPAALVHYPADYPLLLNLQSTDTSTGAFVFKEGQNTIKVTAITNMLSYQNAFIQVTVDNRAADFPATATAAFALPEGNQDRYNGKLLLRWTPPDDGPNQPATYYDLTLSKAGETVATPPFEYLQLGGGGEAVIANDAPAGWVMSPFTAYRATLRPRSIRGLTSTSTVTTPWGVTAPRLVATVFNQATNKKAPNSFRFDLRPDPAPAAGLAALFGGTAIKYDVYSMDGGTYAYPGSGDLPASARLELADQSTVPLQVATGTLCRKYFQIEAKIMNGTTVVKRIRSNVVGALITGPGFQQSAAVPVP